MKKIIDFHAVLLILEPFLIYYMTSGFSLKFGRPEPTFSLLKWRCRLKYMKICASSKIAKRSLSQKTQRTK